MNSSKRQALEDFYAFCRIADDLADQDGLEVQERINRLEALRSWVLEPEGRPHPFWNRLRAARVEFQIPDRCLTGLLDALLSELERLERVCLFESWTELEAYIQGVACDVGEVVLCILGKKQTDCRLYAKNMGQCAQLLNILRDLEEDFDKARIFVPNDCLKAHAISLENFLSSDLSPIREELYQRAQTAFKNSRDLRCRSWVAELMISFYRSAAKKHWRYGDSRRLSRGSKALIALRSLLPFHRSL